MIPPGSGTLSRALEPDLSPNVGSVRTGRTAVVCESQTKPASSQATPPHPYLTPDLNWVIRNSNREGPAQVYAARLPDNMIQQLDA